MITPYTESIIQWMRQVRYASPVHLWTNDAYFMPYWNWLRATEIWGTY